MGDRYTTLTLQNSSPEEFHHEETIRKIQSMIPKRYDKQM
jgi:hypothetical protein